jgi:hypothetical protein
MHKNTIFYPQGVDHQSVKHHLGSAAFTQI